MYSWSGTQKSFHLLLALLVRMSHSERLEIC
jgi:hypothetical protein